MITKFNTYLFASAAFVALLLTGCDVKDPIYNTLYPDSGSITFAPTWDRTNINQAPSEGYAPIFCTDQSQLDFILMSDGSYLVDPGECTAYLYTFLPGVNLNVDDPGNPMAIAWIDYDNPGFIVPDADFFYSGSAPVSVEKDKVQTISVAMRQDVRELTLIIRPQGDATGKVESINSAMNGVAGAWNLHTDAASGEAVNVALVFTKVTEGPNAGDWQATVRLLGITGTEHKLSGAITFTTESGLQPIAFEKDLRTATGFTAFNDDKKTPMGLEAHLVDVHDQLELGDFAPIPGWTGNGDGEDIDGYRAFKATDLKPGDFYYDDNTISDGGLRAIKDGKYVYAAGTFSPETGKTCIGIVFWIDPANPRKGKIISLEEENTVRWDGSQGVTWGRQAVTGATDTKNGAANMKTVSDIITASGGNYTWSMSYPSFGWVMSDMNGYRGSFDPIHDRWYLPAIEELKTLYASMSGLVYEDIASWPNENYAVMPGFDSEEAKDKRTAFNVKMAAAGGIPIETAINSNAFCWSSTEDASNTQSSFYLNFNTASVRTIGKMLLMPMRVRAVSAIDLDAAPPTPRNLTYKVGDYYPDPNAVYSGGVLQSGDAAQGVVFWLDPDAPGYDGSGTPTGLHGKVVSLDEENTENSGGQYGVTWGPTNTATGADSPTDGQANTAKIKMITVWDDNYPAFKWVAAHGADWYLPAKEELKALYAGFSGKVYEDISGWGDFSSMPGYNDGAASTARTAFNALLTGAAGTALQTGTWPYYWSSTGGSGNDAWYVGFGNGNTSGDGKGNQSRVRAVLAF